MRPTQVSRRQVNPRLSVPPALEAFLADAAVCRAQLLGSLPVKVFNGRQAHHTVRRIL